MNLIAPRKGLGIISLMAMVAVLSVFAYGVSSNVAHAEEEPIPAEVGVTSDGVAPVIECKWELPDIESVDGGNGMQYGDDADPQQNPGFPCDRVDVLDSNGFVIGNPPTQADGVKNVIQVVPNAENEPEALTIENWAAVEHPNGVDEIDDVFWKVFHPDGSFKIQIHGTKVQWFDSGDGPLGNDGVVDLNDLGGPLVDGTMFGAAYLTGQVSEDAVTATGWGMFDLVSQRQKDLWYAPWDIHKEQLCGEYTVEVTAVANGVTTSLRNTLEVQCFYNLEIDFTEVNWGTITPGGTRVLPGDTIFGTAGFPTVKNIGNSGMQVGVHFTKLLQVGVPGPKEITQFDAAFGKSASVLEWIDPIPAETLTWFNNTSLNQVLCANEVGKLDLSIHPPSVIPAGAYAGTVTVYGAWAPGLCHDGFDGTVNFPDGLPPVTS